MDKKSATEKTVQLADDRQLILNLARELTDPECVTHHNADLKKLRRIRKAATHLYEAALLGIQGGEN